MLWNSGYGEELTAIKKKRNKANSSYAMKKRKSLFHNVEEVYPL